MGEVTGREYLMKPMRVFAVSPVKGGKVQLASHLSSFAIELTWPQCLDLCERWAETCDEIVAMKLIDADGNWRETMIWS